MKPWNLKLHNKYIYGVRTNTYFFVCVLFWVQAPVVRHVGEFDITSYKQFGKIFLFLTLAHVIVNP